LRIQDEGMCAESKAVTRRHGLLKSVNACVGWSCRWVAAAIALFVLVLWIAGASDGFCVCDREGMYVSAYAGELGIGDDGAGMHKALNQIRAMDLGVDSDATVRESGRIFFHSLSRPGMKSSPLLDRVLPAHWFPYRYQPRAARNHVDLFVPLWMPLAACIGVGSVAWWRYCRRYRRGQCSYCGYDRTGLARGAVCPECGSAPAASSTT
jgi:hypothetical protein